MKYGLFTAGYQRNPVEHMFADAARFGYDFIELWGGRPHAFAPDLSRDGILDLRRLSDRFGIPILAYTPELNAYPYNFMMGTPAMHRDAMALIKHSMDVGKALGADFTLISAGHAGYAATGSDIRTRLTATLTELARYAEQIEHKLVLEPLTPYESNVITNANQLVEALECVPSDYLLGMCDVVPPFVQQESILSYLDKLGPKLYHMHMVDSDGRSDTHLVPGDGVLPLPELMAALPALGYDRTATIELVTNYWNEPRLYAHRAIQRLKESCSVGLGHQNL